MKWCLPVSTALAEASAKSSAVFPSVFLMLGSAPCCSRTVEQHSKIMWDTQTVLSKNLHAANSETQCHEKCIQPTMSCMTANTL